MAAILDGHLQKIEITFLEDRSDPKLYQTHSESIENCYFHVFAIFSNGNHQPSWTVELHKSEKTLFAYQSN